MSKASKSAKVSPDLDTPTDLPQAAVDKISASLNVLLADAFALYMKTKNFHWHVSGRHFRDYHLMLDEQADAIFATTDQIAERVRKLGGITLRSISQIAKLQTIQDNNEAYVPPREMLRELMEDNKHMAAALRKAHKLADDHDDSGTAGLLELFIDETERRTCSCSKPAVRKAPTRRSGFLLRHCLRQTRSVCAREQSDEAIQPSVMPRDGLLRFAASLAMA